MKEAAESLSILFDASGGEPELANQKLHKSVRWYLVVAPYLR